MKLLVLAFLYVLYGVPLLADEVNLRGTTITLQATTQQGAIAEVVFRNAFVNHSGDDGHYPLKFGDLSISVEFHYTPGNDSILITVPPEYVAVPESITVEEYTTGLIFIYSLETVGM